MPPFRYRADRKSKEARPLNLRTFDFYVLIGSVAAAALVSPWFLLALPAVIVLDTISINRRR